MQYTPKNRMPSWEASNLKGSLTLSQQFIVFLGIENIFDTLYTVCASGIHAGSRDIYLGGKFNY